MTTALDRLTTHRTQLEADLAATNHAIKAYVQQVIRPSFDQQTAEFDALMRVVKLNMQTLNAGLRKVGAGE